jgi:S1-C subfamily serine protease
MTNYHVIEGACDDELAGSEIALTFGWRSKESHVSRHKLADAGWLVASDQEFDYAIVRVVGAPGAEPLVEKGTVPRGFLKLVSESPQVNEPLFVLQHPYDKLEGSPATLRFTTGFVLVKEVGLPEYILCHSANTSEGSSGSPVFTGRMDLIAVHHWGGPKHNQAVLASAIKARLAATGHGALLG